MSEDFWNDWGTKTDNTPVPPGEYAARLESCNMEFKENGARTEMTFVIVENQPHAGRYLWVSWPHDAAKFGWLAKMAWDAFGNDTRPPGDLPEHVFASIAQGLGDMRGSVIKLVTSTRTYKNNNGEQVTKPLVKRLERIKTVQAEHPQQQQPQQPQQYGQQPQYGGQGHAANQAPQGQGDGNGNGGRQW
jgi:hypothetical protein